MAKKSKTTGEVVFEPPGYTELRDKLEIDRASLEEVLEQQSGLFEEVSFRLARANFERDTLKLKMEELYAELDGEIREEAAATETKITEAAISNKIKLNLEMQEAQRAYLKARSEAETWQGLVNAYNQRSYTLRDIVAIALRQMSMDGDVIATEQSRQSYNAGKSKLIEKEAGELRRRKRGA